MSTATPWFIRARLRTRHLQLLTAIGEEGNICRAAELMNMSQSAASRLLTDLEDIIGSPLFDRLPRGVRPNWYGLTLIRHARIALASLTEAASQIDLFKAGRTGQVIVGTIPGPALGFVPRAIARVIREYPLMRIQLRVESNEQLLDDELLAGRIEVVISRLLDRVEKSNFNYQRLGDEPLCVVVRTGHPLLERRDIAMQDLAAAAWIAPPPGSTLRHRFDLMFRDSGHASPAQLLETDSPIAAYRLLEETDHLAIMPRHVADHYSAQGGVAVLDVPLACSMDSFGIITRKGWLLSPAACTVCEALEEAAADSSRIGLPTSAPGAAAHI